MAKRTRIKKMPREQFQGVLNLNWAPVRLEGKAIPFWMRRIPEEALHSIYASGTPMPGIPYSDPVVPSGSLIGGIDVYRHAPDDPVKLNKDWYGVITLAGSDSMLLVCGPLSDSEHWLDEIPERLQGATVLAVPPKRFDEEQDA
jgi:hypothetical protein